ncbi:MAG: hypothetical protein ACRDZ7_16285, partial [Acidimicrobiia bacterium]
PVQRTAGTPAPAVVRRTAGLPLASPPPAARPDSAPAGDPPTFVHPGAAAVEAGVARWEADGSVVFHAPGEQMAVQRQDGPDTSSAPSGSAAPGTTAPSTTVTTAPATPTQIPEGLDWEGLVHKLHEEIRWELRGELRRDAGLGGSGNWSH